MTFSKKSSKIVSFIAIICMIQFLCIQNTHIYAAMKPSKIFDSMYSNGRNLFNNFKKDSSLCKKLLYDKQEDTGLIDSSKEEELNEMGFFDSQIESMDKETIHNIENHEVVEAANVYYQVNEKNELVKMSSEKIDTIISKKYKSQIQNVDSEDYLSWLDKLWNIKAKAATKAYDYSNKSVNSGVLQQGVMVTTTGEKGILRVWYQATWLESPHCRGIDICGVSVKYGTPVAKTVNAEYYYNYKVHNNVTGQLIKHEENTVIPKYYVKNTGVIASQNLYSQWSKIQSSNWYPYKMSLNEYIKIEYDISIPSDNYKDLNLVIADYWHKKDSTTYQINPSFSTDGSISLGLSSSQTSTYTHIAPNLAENFTYTSGNK